MLANPIHNRIIDPLINPAPAPDVLLSVGGSLGMSKSYRECLYLAKLNAASPEQFEEGVAYCRQRYPGE